ncbi:MAG: DNA-directed RNA polymerase subunit alpha [Myxococcales bacterium]|nr:DNA-directed RNA polymerase subunit alpha [Myxococcales bacterium]
MSNEYVVSNWRALTRPRRIERDGRSNGTYGKFTVRPLERGFGITLGNSLRRVLLSSLQGAAVTNVKIEGVLHEFSSIPGVIEDVTDIILNIKGILIKTDRMEPIRAVIDIEGAAGEIRVVRAGDIRFDAAAEVLNPDHALCTITGSGRFHAEMTVAMGKGYVPAVRGANADLPIGTVPVDALHMPVRRVKFTVTNARVGQRTDFDKLTLEVWTNGAVTPEDAVAFAAKVLKEQLQVFINFTEEDEPLSGDEPKAQESFNEALFKRVDELDLSVRSANCLQNAGIEYIWQLVERSEAEMLKTKNFGRKSLNEIKELLSELGLSLGMKLNNFPKSRA